MMICPRCGKELVTSEIEDQTVETCQACKGMWLEKNQLNSLLLEIGGDVESCSVDDKPHSDKYPPVTCPRCKDVTMRKINFLDYSDIILDYCEKCGGFWLDRDELVKMKDYIRSVEEGSHHVRDRSAYHLLVRLSEMAYSLFR